MNGSRKGVVLAGLAAAIVLAACGRGESPTSPPTPSTSPGTSATTPPPTGSASTSPAPGVVASGPSSAASAAPSPTSAASASPSGSAAAGGEDTYNKTCVACHGTGVAGAPRLGDKADWGPRIAQGKQVLYDRAIKGYTGQKGVMPPKGGAAQLSDDEVRAAVDYMVGRAS